MVEMKQRKSANKINIETLLNNGMVYQHYQPIFELGTDNLFGHEALMRCKLQLNPEVMFRLAMEQNKLLELDTECISNSILSYFDHTTYGVTTLFVNIFPSTLLHPSFLPALDVLMEKLSSSSIVFELNEAKEQEEIWNVGALKDKIRILKNNGFKIAIDDVGEGAAGLRKIVDFQPDFIKMSRYFASDLAKAERKQRIAKLFVDYCRNDTQLILEGIEKKEDLECAKHIGIDYGQGFLLGKPKELVSNE